MQGPQVIAPLACRLGPSSACLGRPSPLGSPTLRSSLCAPSPWTGVSRASRRQVTRAGAQQGQAAAQPAWPVGSHRPAGLGAADSWPSEEARRTAYSTLQQESYCLGGSRYSTRTQLLAPTTPFSVIPARPEGVPVAARVEGRIPPWLTGSFVRNGPGEFSGMQHLFDGYALLARLEVIGSMNTVMESHRFLESEAYKRWRASGRMRWREFATKVPHASPLSRAGEVLEMVLGGAMGLGQSVTDNACVSVVPRRDKLLALTETIPGAFVVDPGTLRTLHRMRYEDKLGGDGTTAHPSVLPNGDLINLISTAGKGYTVVRQQAADPAVRRPIARIPHRQRWAQSWVHDFPSTPNYTVLPEQPLYYNLKAILSGRETEFVIMDWRPEDGTLLHVVSHRTGRVKTISAPPFVVMHWVNAFESEDGRYLHLDAAVYDDPTPLNDLYLSALRAGPGEGRPYAPSRYRRLTLDLQAPEGAALPDDCWEPLVSDEDAYQAHFEMPSVSPAHRCLPYRHAYGVNSAGPTNMANAWVKFDTNDRSCQVARQLGGLCGEPLFVPAPHPASEDDGVLLGLTIQPDGTSALVFLDGRSMGELARAVLPFGLPLGFHGAFLRRAAS